jgi:diacylglycerol O-acyltransferase / wax synthase
MGDDGRVDEPLSPVDSAWLHMDRGTNRMVITAVLLFDEVIARAQLVRLFEERLPHARFRERVVERGGLRRPRWTPAAVSFEDHVIAAAWPAPGDEGALERFVAELAATPLDPARPLWSAHLLEGDGRCAVVFRAHHCLADGLALVSVLLRLTDEAVAGELPVVGREPERRGRSALEELGRGVRHGLTLAKLLALAPDPRTWKARLGVPKTTAWTRPLPLDDVKREARAAGAHVTDVLLACVAGALRRSLGSASPRRDVRALVPVFFRPAEGSAGAAGLGNRFGLIYVPLAVDEPDVAARVRRLRDQTARLKLAADAAVALEVLGLFGRLSRALESAGVVVFTSKASAMITSVPGPPAPLRLLGRDLVDIIAFGPAAGSIGLTAGLFSYRGHIRVAFSVDPAIGVDARRLAEAYEDEAALLARATDLEPSPPRTTSSG